MYLHKKQQKLTGEIIKNKASNQHKEFLPHLNTDDYNILATITNQKINQPRT